MYVCTYRCMCIKAREPLTKLTRKRNEIPAEVVRGIWSGLEPLNTNYAAKCRNELKRWNWSMKNRATARPATIYSHSHSQQHTDWGFLFFGLGYPFIELAIHSALEKSRQHQWNGKMTQVSNRYTSNKVNNNNPIEIQREIRTIYSNDKRLGIGALRPD